MSACSRCDELRERVAWLEAELGLRGEAEALDALNMAFGLARGVAQIVMRLYRAKGHLVTKAMLEEAIDHKFASDEPCRKFVEVYIGRARRALGFAAIRTAPGLGYAMQPEGLGRIDAILSAYAAFKLAALAA